MIPVRLSLGGFVWSRSHMPGWLPDSTLASLPGCRSVLVTRTLAMSGGEWRIMSGKSSMKPCGGCHKTGGVAGCLPLARCPSRSLSNALVQVSRRTKAWATLNHFTPLSVLRVQQGGLGGSDDVIGPLGEVALEGGGRLFPVAGAMQCQAAQPVVVGGFPWLGACPGSSEPRSRRRPRSASGCRTG